MGAFSKYLCLCVYRGQGYTSLLVKTGELQRKRKLSKTGLQNPDLLSTVRGKASQDPMLCGCVFLL